MFVLQNDYSQEGWSGCYIFKDGIDGTVDMIYGQHSGVGTECTYNDGTCGLGPCSLVATKKWSSSGSLPTPSAAQILAAIAAAAQ